MTIPSAVNKSGPYFYNGATTSFAYGFKISDETHIRVVETVIATGVETDLVLSTDYTVTGVNSDTGTVVISPARASGKSVTLVRAVPFTQQVVLENQGAYFAKVVEKAFDNAVARDQQLQEQIDRAIKVSVSSDLSPDELIADLTAGSAAAVAAAISTAADAAATAADRVQTGVDAAATAADRVQTGLDAVATAADRVQTGLDRTAVATNKGLVDTAKAAVDVAKAATDANVVLTNADKVATAADRVQTGLDRVATGADRVQTGLDRVAAAASAATAASLVAPPKGHLYGLTLSNNVTDATNDIDIAAGECASDGTTAALMTLATGLTKRLDAVWAVGTNAGMLASGAAIADTTYHIFVIKRPDTGVVDIAADTSVPGANIAANTNAAYTQIRRIGSIVRVSGAIKLFYQHGDEFVWHVPVQNFNNDNPGTAAQTITTTVPTGVVVLANIAAETGNGGTNHYIFFSPLAAADTLPSSLNSQLGVAGNVRFNVGRLATLTNTSGQIRMRTNASAAGDVFVVNTIGFTDYRGRT